MSAVDNVATLRRLIEAVNQDELAHVAPEVIAPSFVRHDLGGTWPGVRGEGGVIDLIGLLRAALPDLQLEVDDIFGADDRVAMRFTLRGTHRAELLGRPPTGRWITVSGINLYRLADGKIAETWQLVDVAGLVHQLEGA
jgi:steroid delta-isomerase-like uncharacterized protein